MIETVPECKRRPISSPVNMKHYDNYACRIPKLDPWSPCITRHINKPFKQLQCKIQPLKYAFTLDFKSEDGPFIQTDGDIDGHCCFTSFSYKKAYDYA